MYKFCKDFLYFFVAWEIVIFFWFFFGNEITSHEYFLYEFIFVIYLNFYSDSEQDEQYMEKSTLNIDIIFKYLFLLFKTPSYFVNFLINTTKKIFIFLFFYKYRLFLNTMRILTKKYFYNFFVTWRPLFKKTSYFGYYRANRSKWIK